MSILASLWFWALLLLSVGVGALLPGVSRLRPAVRLIGVALAAVGLGLFLASLPGLATIGEQTLFWVFSAAALASAVATISLRSPLYSAICFAMMLLAVAGLYLLQGAQFLGMANVVVYAGAILVMFLFVLMLAQPEGNETYDRISWGWFPPACATLLAALFVGALVQTVLNLNASPASPKPSIAASEHHMAHLGGYLFSHHLVAIEVAGTLLLAALVGAVAIIIHGRARPQTEGDAA